MTAKQITPRLSVEQAADMIRTAMRVAAERGIPDGIEEILVALGGTPPGAFDFRAHLQRQREWSERTFGPGPRTAGVLDHIRKELREIEAEPTDLREWIDVAILALDGAWRAGFDPDEIIDSL